MSENKKVLVVDDDDTLRTSILTVLGERGYTTYAADDGLEARRLIDRHQPDLVILDMMMPRWGGLAVLEHFKGKPEAPRFIMVSANEIAKHTDYAKKMGAATYLRKPFAMDQLMEQVDLSLSSPGEIAPVPKGVCRCPHCSARINVPKKFFGRTHECPGCKQRIELQPEAPMDEGVKLVP
ncbi:MAG: response regulator [Gemmataceae bacterium]